MGLSGTDTAKNASDIVILDDRFGSIVQAVKWGRSVYDNIRKFLQFQLTVNVVALAITFIAAVMPEVKHVPLNAIMMLWVNLIMDTMGALALGTEQPTLELLERRPYKRNASLVSIPMWRNILVQSFYQLIIMVLFLQFGEEWLGIDDKFVANFGLNLDTEGMSLSEMREAYRNTFIFNAFVFCQVFNEINARRIDSSWNVFRGMHTNWLFIAILLVTVGMQAFIVEVGADFTKTTGLNGEHWGWSILIGLGAMPMGIIMRFIPAKERENDFYSHKAGGIKVEGVSAHPLPHECKFF